MHRLQLNKDEFETILRQNPKIQELKMREWVKVFPGDNTNKNKYVFIVDFSLKQRFCDSEFPKFSFLIEQRDVLKIYGITAYFECKLYEKETNSNNLTIQHKQQLNSIFKGEVIEKLRQNSSQ